jgi:hypothetical protein
MNFREASLLGLYNYIPRVLLFESYNQHKARRKILATKQHETTRRKSKKLFEN